MSRLAQLKELFVTFGKIGLFTFGGGYAMIALMQEECVEKRRWIDGDEMLDLTAIAESTPGPIAINCATYVGYQQLGWIGAIAATLGIVFPSFCVIYLISMFFDQILEYPLVAGAFHGIKIAVGWIILSAGIKMFQKMKKKPLPLFFFLTGFLTIIGVNFFSLPVSTVWLLLCAGGVSLCLSFLPQPAGSGKGGASA